MNMLGNVIWFLFGGCLTGLMWAFEGCFWCITIIGIPWGLQCFKFASLSFFPFGKEIIYGGGVASCLGNVIWMILSGIPLAICHGLFGLIYCITVVGIPFGMQHFKLAKLALMPFGARIL